MVTHPSLLVKQWKRIWSQFLANKPLRRRLSRVSTADAWRTAIQIESLEKRSMLSAFSALSHYHANTTFEVVHNATHSTSVVYSPSQIQNAYGFNQISNNGAGQTIAIIDAYDDPTIQADLQLFDSSFNLAAPPSLKVVSQTGSTSALPGTDPTKGWEVEESLDVQWAHALAPAASIVLVEANSASDADLFTAVATAANLPGVSVVSMSFGGGEFNGEAAYDSVFTTPSGHQGVTFLASTGDNGAPGGFPAYSSNVLAVGGTTLSADSSGNYIAESGWSGSGGGISPYESQPAYQHGVVAQSTTNRTIPDVSFDADPNSGVYVVDSFTNGSSNPWMALGGTSFAAPAWAAIIALVDQGRVADGLSSLDGATQTLPMLYQLDQTNPSAFHDVTSGNNGHAAGTGYDLVTGLGSPVVNVLTSAMSGSGSGGSGSGGSGSGGSGSGGSGSGGSGSGGSGSSSNSVLVFQHCPTSATAGVMFGTLTLAVENQSGQVVKTDSSTITLTLSSGTFSSGSTTVTASVVKGVATFSGVIVDASGNYTLTASDGSMTGASSSVTINPAGAKQPVWQTAPSSTAVAGTALSPVLVDAEDSYGNLVTAPAAVTIKITGGKFSNGSTSISASAISGVATFNNVIINAVGSYTLTACIGSQTTSSIDVTVSPGAASKLVWRTAPASTAIAGAALNTIVAVVEDAWGNVVTTDTSAVTLTLSSGAFSTGLSTATVTAANGIATFSSLAINTIGTYKITASDSGSLTTVTSGNVLITPSSLSSLAVQQSPSTGTAGLGLATIKVQALDQYGNLIKASTGITLTLSSGTFSTGSSSATASTSAGVATFSHLIIETSGNYTLAVSADLLSGPSITIAINPANAKLPVWHTAPSATAVAGTTLSTILVDAEDAFGNLVTTAPTVTMRLTGGKFASGATSEAAVVSGGVATFSDLTINKAGSYTLTAYIGSQATTSSNITINPAAASQLVWKTAPETKTIAGTSLNTLIVAVEDAFGNVVTTDNSTVTATLSSGTFSTGSATATATAVKGIASLNSLAIDTTGTYQITASDSASLTTVTSGNVIVTPAAVSSLAIQQNPTTATAGQAWAPVVQVQALDQFGNLVTASTMVTLTLTGGSFANKSTTVTASTHSGIATFTNLIIDTAGNYTLTTSTGSITGASFNLAVSPAAASRLVWQTAPDASAVAGASLGSIVVTVQDAFGNVITSDNSTVTLTLSRGTFTTGSSTISVTAVNGVATFSDVAITTAGSYKISATDSASSARISSNSIAITPAS